MAKVPDVLFSIKIAIRVLFAFLFTGSSFFVDVFVSDLKLLKLFKTKETIKKLNNCKKSKSDFYAKQYGHWVRSLFLWLSEVTVSACHSSCGSNAILRLTVLKFTSTDFFAKNKKKSEIPPSVKNYFPSRTFSPHFYWCNRVNLYIPSTSWFDLISIKKKKKYKKIGWSLVMPLIDDGCMIYEADYQARKRPTVRYEKEKESHNAPGNWLTILTLLLTLA